ncbi:MAG: CARDB domain-containing protein [Caldilinea sp.]
MLLRDSIRFRRQIVRAISAIAIASLLLNSTESIVRAQDSGSIYLPIIAGGAAPTGNPSLPTDVNLFRTRVTVKTTAQWDDLARTGAVVLDRGEDWALVLADDEQLADLARWRFAPEETNLLRTLVIAAGASDVGSAAAARFVPLLEQIDAANAIAAADSGAKSSLRSQIRSTVAMLTAEERVWLSQVASLDSDGDGLTNDQEGFWCTDAARPDSDFDGANDGTEVQILKRWVNHQLAAPPIGTAQPFNGWPFNETTCVDNDRDAIPNLAERWEIGTNMNIESTDRDRYDDGQELYGTTYCPGSGNACGYGQLPSANHDGILLFPQMPAWVTAPGNHPLVAAFPKIEINIVANPDGKTFQVRLATVITTDERHEEGETKSYSTTKTEGTSTSNADTESWENWQEISRTDEATGVMNSSAAGSSRNSTVNIIESTNINTTNVNQIYTKITVKMAQKAKSTPQGYLMGKVAQAADFAIDEACKEVQCRKYGGAIIGATARSVIDIFTGSDNLQNAFQQNNCNPTALDWTNISCQLKSVGTLWKNNFDTRVDAATKAEQDANAANAGMNYSTGNGVMDAQTLYPISYPMPAFVPTITETSGSSRGGARTTTHTTYEEHSVTEGTAKQIGKSWGTATAHNSAHAANLWFAYEVRNAGSDYARQICNLAFGIYIGAASAPAVTYYPANDFGGSGCLSNFRPGEVHKYAFPAQSRVALTLDQVKAIDLGEPVRIVIEDMSLGQDDYYTDDAVSSNMAIAMEDGTDDGDERIDTYLIPTWGSETVLNVLGRYFPHETDANGMMTAIWTPEYRSDTPSWCREARRPTDQPSKAVWCKHTLSTADWWNVYTDGLGDGSEGFQETPAVPGATALFRFNQDSDLDGFSDRSEARLGTDADDASSFPRPEVLAGVHNIQAGSRVTSTLSLLNTGLYDAYGVEAVMVAPDDSIKIDNNTVGGSGRVKALNQVIVGSRISLQSPLPAAWTQANHAVPAPGGYYTGRIDRTYIFTVNCATAGGCKVGEGSWTLAWNDGRGASGSLPFGAGYASPIFVPVGAAGLTLALYSGSVQNGESFTVAATTPRDTFQYTINRTPYTPPLVLVSYNDPQGNHRFVVPSQAMSLTAPTDTLQPFAGQMLQDVGVEIVTGTPFTMGANSVQLLVNNPSDATLQNAHLFLEFINISGTVVSEVPVTVTLPPGPTYTPVSFSTGSFNPSFDANQDYIVMAFLTDYQGNILDTAGRPLSSFQEDPLPKVAVDATSLTWNFGTVAQGALLRHRPALANVGYGRLYTYLTPTSGLSLAARADVVGAADLSNYELILRTADLPIGAYDRTATLKTSDPAQPVLAVRVQGTVTAAVGDTAGGLQRPLDVPVTVIGPKSQGEWVSFTHTLGPDPQILHPVKVYPQDYTTLYGVGRYATDFSAGTASYDMFGDGRDGVMPGSGNLDNNNGAGIAIVNSGAAGATSINVTDAYGGWRINPGDAVLIHQTQGSGAGCWEMNRAASDYVGGTATIQMAVPLKCNYASGGSNRAQVLRVPQYSTCNVTGTVTPLYAWNGSTGGIFAVMCRKDMTVLGGINASGYGYRGGISYNSAEHQGGTYGLAGEGHSGPQYWQAIANASGGGGGEQHSNGGPGGGGGGNATMGSAGGRGAGSPVGAGGNSSVPKVFPFLFLGGGGGGGARAYSNPGGTGGSGGGIILVHAQSVSVSGVIVANGNSGANGSRNNPPPENQYGNSGGGGAGAGGSILLVGGNFDFGISRVTALGGIGGARGGDKAGDGGSGGFGGIQIDYCESSAGATTPAASTQKLTCHIAEQTESAPYTGGRLNLSENITTSKTYQVQYARRLTFAAAGSQTTLLTVPAGMASTVALQALASGLPASASFALDIGNDGSTEWSGTVANASTNSSPDLAAAFNAYWAARGAPVAGSLDVPVKVTMSQPGQVLLTNLQMTTAGSKQRTLRLNAGTVTQATLDLALGGSGQQAISVAVDVGADGSLDWTNSVSTTLPVRLMTGDVAAAFNTYLAGKSGSVDVPIRIFVAPDLSVTLYDASIAMQPAADLRVAGLAASAPAAQVQAATAGYESGDVVPLSATVTNPGSSDSGPLTVAFFADAAGWGDWYIGSAFVENIAPGGSAQATTEWNTLGFSGPVTVTAVVNPYGSSTETNYANNRTTTTVQIDLFAQGDVNGDSSINVLDLQRQINMILHAIPRDLVLYPEKEWLRADLDGNTVWNVLDLQRLINLIQAR